jgi:tRNA dimethylallyltransferase
MKVIIIGGPTASGKSNKAIQIAKETNGAVVSADSRQIYIGMDIGTAKVATRKGKPDWRTPIQYEGIEHYLIDIISPNERYSLFDFKFQAEEIIKKLLEQNIQPIVAGGPGL